jgi:hypothetical protein
LQKGNLKIVNANNGSKLLCGRLPVLQKRDRGRVGGFENNIDEVSDASRVSFTPPRGIEIVTIDADTLMLATPLCQNTFVEAFIFSDVCN